MIDRRRGKAADRRAGARVRQSRLQRGCSQEELAATAGLHRTYVGGIERRERNVALDNIYSLAAALQVPVSELFDKPAATPG